MSSLAPHGTFGRMKLYAYSEVHLALLEVRNIDLHAIHDDSDQDGENRMEDGLEVSEQSTGSDDHLERGELTRRESRRASLIEVALAPDIHFL